MKSCESPTTIRSVERAVQWLLWIADRDGARASDVAAEFDVPLPSVHHTLTTLCREGLLVKDRDRRYLMGTRVGLLADAFLRQETIPWRLREPLEWLAETTQETAYLAAWRGGEIRILACVEGSRAVRVAGLHLGYYEHAHARATGKLLLALAKEERRSSYLETHSLEAVTAHTITDVGLFERELARTRERGFAIDVDEFADGVSCIAMPVVDGGHLVGAYTVSCPSHRFSDQQKTLTGALVRATTSARAAGNQPVTEQGPSRK